LLKKVNNILLFNSLAFCYNLKYSKKIYTLLFLSICISFSAQIEGSWSLNPAAGVIGVGPDSATKTIKRLYFYKV